MITPGNFIPTGQPPRIVVVGSINMDLVARVERLPQPGETVASQSLVQLPGGKGANQVVGAARLGAKSIMLGRLGDDSFSPVLQDSLEQANVDTGSLLFSEGCSSGVALIGVEASGQNSITIVSGANGQVSLDDVAYWDDVLTTADMILVQLEIPHVVVERVLERAEECGIITILDPAPMPSSQLGTGMYRASILTPNQTEAEQLVGYPVTNHEEAVRAAEELQRRGAGTVVVKMGEAGAVVVDEAGHSEHIMAPQVEVVDTTAAGDAFNAGLAVALVEGKKLSEAIQFACATGSLATCKPGAQPAMPTRMEVDKLLSPPHR
ncbi:MAG: ribokinase [Planctomycetaceae bacterium]